MKQWFILALIFVTVSSMFAQTKTVTNNDLEQFRQKRLKAEKDYRENYEKLGFPSPEELQKQNEKSKQELAELSQRIEAENAQKENYYQSRANALLTEIAAIDAQIAYLRTGINNLPDQSYIYSFGYAPYFRQNRPIVDPYYIQPLPNLANNQILINQYPYRNNRRSSNNQRRHFYPQSYAAPIIIDNNPYQSSDVVLQFSELKGRRAGLLAEWRILEEEANKAGVRIN